MKQLILIVGMILTMTVKLMAQDNKGIEVKSFQKQETGVQKEPHQFEIVAHEDIEVNLKFSMKTEDNLKITVTDTKNKTILAQNFKKAGENKLIFPMEENEKYLIKIIGEKQSNLIVQLSE